MKIIFKISFFLSVFILSLSCSNASAKKDVEKSTCEEVGIFCDEEENTLYDCIKNNNGTLLREVFETCKSNETCITGVCSSSECIPTGEEVCDGIDNDCDNFIDEALIAPPASLQSGVCKGSKKICKGTRGWVDPDYEKIEGYQTIESKCDGIDENCDGKIDEGLKNTYYEDNDKDGYGDPTSLTERCDITDKYVNNSLDCNDNNKDINPDANEICDGIDNDCDGKIDIEDDSLEVAPLNTNQIGICEKSKQICTGEKGWNDPVLVDLPDYDIDDLNCDGIDNNCNEKIDEGYTPTICTPINSDNLGVTKCVSGQPYCSPVKSCLEIKTYYTNSDSGFYQIDPDENGGNPPFEVYCDMDYDGGGWTVFEATEAKGIAKNGFPGTFPSGQLIIGASISEYNRKSFMKFNYNQIKSVPYTQAKFKLNVIGGDDNWNSGNIQFRIIKENWNASDLTWDNRPEYRETPSFLITLGQESAIGEYTVEDIKTYLDSDIGTIQYGLAMPTATAGDDVYMANIDNTDYHGPEIWIK